MASQGLHLAFSFSNVKIPLGTTALTRDVRADATVSDSTATLMNAIYEDLCRLVVPVSMEDCSHLFIRYGGKLEKGYAETGGYTTPITNTGDKQKKCGNCSANLETLLLEQNEQSFGWCCTCGGLICNDCFLNHTLIPKFKETFGLSRKVTKKRKRPSNRTMTQCLRDTKQYFKDSLTKYASDVDSALLSDVNGVYLLIDGLLVTNEVNVTNSAPFIDAATLVLNKLDQKRCVQNH